MTLINVMKKDKWKSFVAMSLMSSKLILKDDKLLIYINNEFNYKMLSTAEIKSYISEKMNELFSIEASVETYLDNSVSWPDLMADVMDVF
jgi:hypothetical protein